jgi:hypothetical protein
LSGDGQPIPTLLAFLVCETVIHDAQTQKKTVVGIFSHLLSEKVPSSANVGLYGKLVEGSGQYRLKIRLVHLKDEKLVMEAGLDANWAVPEQPLELSINLRGLPIPDFGQYEFQMFANEVYLGRAVFRVDKMPLPSSNQP